MPSTKTVIFDILVLRYKQHQVLMYETHNFFTSVLISSINWQSINSCLFRSSALSGHEGRLQIKDILKQCR